MFCSFRLYGDFVWPPVPDTSKTAPTRQGLVEIWFDRLDPPGAKAGRLRAFLRWRPGNVVGADGDAPPQLPAPEVNIFELPKGWFEDHADAELTVWIHGYDGKKGGEVLAFRGALLFEQLQAQAGTLRWPVIREAALGNSGKTTLSELIIGQPVDPKAKASKDNFRFNLHLPTPWPQHTLAGAGFPFGVIYDSDVASEAAATLYDTLTAGPRGADVTVTDEPQTKRLGAFGFAPVRAGAPDYAGATAGLEPYWPQASATGLYLSLLGAIGIATDTTSGRPKLLRSGPTEMSFRPGFDTTPGSSRNWYVSRLSFAPPSGSGGTGDLCWADGQFYLHLEEELGGYLQLRQLYLDVIVEFAIPDAAIWSGYAAWRPQLKLRPHWQSALAKGPLGKQPTALFRGRPAFSAGTLPDGANAMRAALADLYRVEAAQPQSVLPDLSVPFAQQPRFALYAPPVEVGFSATGLVQFAGNPPATQATPLRLSLLDPQHLVAPEQPATLQLRADLPSFFTLAPKPLPLQLDHDAGWVATGSWNDVAAAQSQPYFARFMVRASPEAGNVDKTVSWSGRLASIEFSAHDTVLDYRGSRLSIAGRGLGNRGHYAIPSGTGFAHPVAVQLQLNLPFTSARPVGVDLRRGTNVDRAAPLLIDLDAQAVGTAPKATQFHLKITEYLAPVGDRLLEAEVFDNSGETGERNYVVLSEEPFAINRFSTRVLGARGGADSASVAFYSSERRLWEFRRVAEFYRYSFPAQAVGESADKPRRLEIHDLRDDEAPEGDGGPHRPYLADPADPQSSLRRRAVEFALTPSAEIWIQPSDVERGYFMPEWNSHEIFRQRGELGLGTALAWLRAEFVYGLPVGIEVGKERGLSRRARVAEIEVLTGLPLGTTDSGTPLADRWNALSNAIARRPERLEVWADNPDSVLDFAPARFSDGASFALRQTALLRAPVLRDGVEPAETAAHYAQLPKSRGGLRYHPQGLSGGAIWPVESANLFDALADSPLATGGEIENIALSPLGGDAAQKALFLGGKVTIITRTRNGHIERQQVEVLGRIGALWHRAKHVVVYERTVNPSAQFAPTQQEDPLRTRSRRPILRKVREYIELLQPERAYPDFAQASARSAGFLDRVRFNAHIINVDSAWGHDIGTDAWEIPLWNRQAARQRPQVYPLPDLAFVSVAEGDGERPVVAQECRDPDNLYFFTDFKASSADTDLWLQRLGIDYANMPSAGAIAQVHDRRSAQDPGLNGRAERRRPPVSQSLPGLRRFTWRLASAPRKVAINAGRAAKPIYVGLESISFMRAGQAADSGLFAPLAGLLAQSMALSDAVLPEGLGYWGTNSAAAIFPAGAAFSACVSTLRAALEQHQAPDVIAQARDALQASLTILGDEAPTIVKTVAGGITTGLSAWHDAASSIASKSTRNCDQLKTGALATLRRKAMLVESLLRDWEADIGTLLDAALAGGSKQALLEQLADSAIAAIRPAFEDSAAGVANIGERAEQARAILGDLEAEADATMRRAMERVKQYAATYERDKPWSAARRNTCYSDSRRLLRGWPAKCWPPLTRRASA